MATPIGNLEDISYRAVRILSEVDFIIAEDTRTTIKLLNHYNINKKLISCHKFNEKARLEQIIDKLQSGEKAALVTDAGTPCISDPGYILVRQSADLNIPVAAIPGPSSVIAALSVSGFELNSFAFYGFLPKEPSKIKKLLEKIKEDLQHAAVFFESPNRIIKTLEIISKLYVDANVCLCNDISKKFEKIYRGSVDSVLIELNENPDYNKGEYTLVLQKNILSKRLTKKADIPDNVSENILDNISDNISNDISNDISIEALLFDIIYKNNCTVKDAVNILYKQGNNRFRKKDIYDAGVRLQEKGRFYGICFGIGAGHDTLGEFVFKLE